MFIEYLGGIFRRRIQRLFRLNEVKKSFAVNRFENVRNIATEITGILEKHEFVDGMHALIYVLSIGLVKFPEKDEAVFLLIKEILEDLRRAEKNEN